MPVAEETLNVAPLLSVPMIVGSDSLPLPEIFVPFVMVIFSASALFGFVLAFSMSEAKPLSSISLIV
ncbi:hypothetical protein GWP40_05675 [Treponema vincentii]|uniref:hypothetical protein n=1 Tax=Treponema vincentii TaxID=69710 RepID=UPI001BAF1BFB|nr:hypothetical protein [Treponema vincentii]QUY17885.1 hypothetical protein GWP40_05675 [Treponema vincentii]